MENKKEMKNKQTKKVNLDKKNNLSSTPVLPKQITYQEVKDLSIEIPIIINNESWGFFTTKWDRQEFYKIHEQFPDREFKLLCDKNNQPLLDKNGDPLKDFNDSEIATYNYRQKLLRMAHLIRLVGRYMDFPENDGHAIEFLKEIPSDIYNIIEKNLNEIIKHKFVTLHQMQEKNIKQLLAASRIEKAIQDRENKKIENEKDKLLKEIKFLRDKYNKSKDEKEKKSLENKISKLQNELDDLFKKQGKTKDEYSYKAGIKHYGLLMKLKKEYHLSVEFMLKILNNTLTEDENILYQMMWNDLILNMQYEKETYDELEKERNKNKGGKEGRN